MPHQLLLMVVFIQAVYSSLSRRIDSIGIIAFFSAALPADIFRFSYV
jgi:hypothetical protein